MTHVTCSLTAKNGDQLRNPTLGNRLWATFTFLYGVRRAGVRGRALSIPLRDAGRRLCLLLRANISHHQTPEQGHGHRGSRCHDNRGVT